MPGLAQILRCSLEPLKPLEPKLSALTSSACAPGHPLHLPRCWWAIPSSIPSSYQGLSRAPHAVALLYGAADLRVGVVAILGRGGLAGEPRRVQGMRRTPWEGCWVAHGCLCALPAVGSRLWDLKMPGSRSGIEAGKAWKVTATALRSPWLWNQGDSAQDHSSAGSKLQSASLAAALASVASSTSAQQTVHKLAGRLIWKAALGSMTHWAYCAECMLQTCTLIDRQP